MKEVFMGIALFYITSGCITYLSAIYFGRILVEDLKANNQTAKFISKKSKRESIPWIFKVSLIPILNIIVALIIARTTYSYHQYTLGYTDYNIFEEEGKF
jgi:uncharacterized membrane protein YdjX (TVP38/TMEM64 family)